MAFNMVNDAHTMRDRTDRSKGQTQEDRVAREIELIDEALGKAPKHVDHIEYDMVNDDLDDADKVKVVERLGDFHFSVTPEPIDFPTRRYNPDNIRISW